MRDAARPTVTRFLTHSDARGTMTVGDSATNLPFVPMRFFRVADVPAGDIRGNHAHKTCHQLLICTAGKIVVRTEGAASGFEEFVLDTSDHGLHIPPLTWASQQYETVESQLLVLASESYDAAEYIRDPAEFATITGHHLSPAFGIDRP
jgi:UDP-2-acetamido-3-amino-2,3-dideoxy-glucuronate N-acetyltransferase